MKAQKYQMISKICIFFKENANLCLSGNYIVLLVFKKIKMQVNLRTNKGMPSDSELFIIPGIIFYSKKK